MTWTEAKAIMGAERVTLGPQASHQFMHDPKHLLFVLARYKHAARLIGNAETVLELGCGEGLGARILAKGRGWWHGVDSDHEAILLCRATLPAERFSVERDDIRGYVAERPYDAVVSLDVAEHIPADQERRFMDSATTNLTPDGVCVIGTPNATAAKYQSPASAAGHVNLYSAMRLSDLMARHFRYSTVFGMNDETLTTGYLPMAHYLMALGVGPR